MKISLKKALPFVICMMVLSLCGCGEQTTKLNTGMEYIASLDYDKALACFEEAADAGEDLKLVNRGQGIAYLAKAEYESAQEAFVQALNQSDGIIQDVDFDINYYLATAYIKNGEYEEALNVCNSILDLRPAEKDAYFIRGEVYLMTDDYTSATADFDMAISLAPKDYDRLIDICKVLINSGYEDVSKVYLNNALVKYRDSMKNFDLGRIYFFLGDYEQAAGYLEKTRSGDLAEGYLFLGKCYEEMGDYNYAASVYNSYITKDSANAAIYNQLGMCELKRGNYELAIDSFEKGIAIGNTECMQSLLFNRIVGYEYVSDFSKAAVLMKEYLSYYPDDAMAQRENIFLSTR